MAGPGRRARDLSPGGNSGRRARVTDPWGGTRTGFSARTSISRKDYGLTWNVALEAGGFVVGDKLEISLEIEAVKKAATAAA